MFKNLITRTLLLLAFVWQLTMVFSCQSKMTKVENKAVVIDSITGEALNGKGAVDSVFEVHTLAAVFFMPNKKTIDSLMAVDGEGYRQMAKEAAAQQQAAREFIESKNIRVFYTDRQYLQFSHSTGSPYKIDRSTNGKLWGVYLFDHENPPRLADANKIELEYLQYFLK